VISSGFQGNGVPGSFAGHIEVCVDDASPAGTYMFTNSAWNSGHKINGVVDIDHTQQEITNPAQRGTNSFPIGSTSTPYQVLKGALNCVRILDRSAPSTHYSATDDDGVGPNAMDDFQAVTILASSMPPGVVFDRLDCVLDIGDWTPSNSAGVRVCNNTSNPSKAYANFDHGARLIFVFKESPETPCPAGSFTASMNGSGDLVMTFDQFPAPNDNSYGINAVGWPGGHTFGNLTGSDKAGFQLKNAAGTVVLDFNIDYLSAKSGTPSGYGSLGPFGGDGDVNVGTLSPSDIIYTTSLAENLNSTGFCTGGNCSGLGTNLLVNSPATDPGTYNLVAGSPYGAWNFHDTYYVTITAAKLAALGLTGAVNQPGGWSAAPNLTALHNSPAKPCPPGPFPCSDITIGAKTFGSKEVKTDVNNVNTTKDAFVTGVHLTWPVGTNGALKQIKIGGDVIWTGTNTSGNVNFALADLVADANKRKIAHKTDEDVKFVFANNVSTTLADYTASLDFGDTCNKPILP
jgi:hypothetical protein